MLNNTIHISQRIEIETMFLQHYKEWCLLSYSYIESMTEAEDMVQDVFIKILNKKNKHEIVDLKSYISTAVRNTCLKNIKQSKRSVKLNEYNTLLSPSHEESLIDVENKVQVQAAIQILPEQSKKIFQLCVLEDFKYQKAADSLGISINTVKFHLKKAFKILRLNLQDAY